MRGHVAHPLGVHGAQNLDPLMGCQIAVARHGHMAYQKSFGSMDLERNKPMADDAIFRIYSMTKPITSIALMTLYEKGYFQLNDPISRYVPSWKNHRVWVSGEGEDMVTEAPKRPVSFRDVLSHSGGFTYGGGLPGVGAQKATKLVTDAETYIKNTVKAGALAAVPEIEAKAKKKLMTPVLVIGGLGALGTFLGAIALVRTFRR